MASTVLPNGIIIPEKYSRDWYADLYHNWQELDNLLGGGTPKDGTLTIQKNGNTAGTFSANQATDETINIEVPDVNNGTLTIQQNGTTVDTFTANSSSDKTVNISVPTKTSDLNNDSGFITGVTWNDVADKPSFATVATSGSYNDLSNKPTIPTVNNATLTIQKNGATVKTFTANASTNVTANITVPTKVSELTNDSGFLTSHQSLSNYSTLANTIKSLSISGKTITYTKGDNTTGTLTTQDNNTWTAMVGATSSSNGSVGYVNAVPPKDGYNTKYLRADGTWQVPPDHTYNVYNKTLTIQKNGTNVATFTSNSNTDVTANITVPTKTSDLTNDSGFLTSHQDLSGYVPRSGGAVMTGGLYRTNTTGSIDIGGGTNWDSGALIGLRGANHPSEAGLIILQPATSSSVMKWMYLHPNGTWTWDGTACQITSDQRYKQQISEIDDKLLDAWEDVNLVQFKYNDAVNEKGKDKARLHTGYVVQQIDSACKSHGVDISEYGLYCHEEYPQETEEVEVEQKDGTKTKERKVIREASEHYSLRYTEVYAVECMYLRRCIARLTARIEELEKGNNTK